MKIVVIGRYPDNASEREGMSQRIMEVDSLMRDQERVYLDLHPFRHFCVEKRVMGKLTVIKAHPILHFNLIAQTIAGGRTVYIHSAYNALLVALFLGSMRSRRIFDLHGIVPEEEALLGRIALSKVMGYVEHMSLAHADSVIAISNEMTDYLTEKYPELNIQDKTLRVPVMSFSIEDCRYSSSLLSEKFSSPKRQVIYSGGVQRWQNIEKMLQSIRTIKSRCPESYQFSIFVPKKAIQKIERMLSQHELGDVELGSLPHAQITERLKSTHLGFILREDIPVNRVAMPTKLAEYLQYGVVPVVLSPRIGDYLSLAYQYIRLEDWLDDPELYDKDLASMAAKNLLVLETLSQQSRDALNNLRDLLKSTNQAQP